MKLPFSTDEFLKVFRDYNTATWPAQYALVLVAVAILLFIIKPVSYSTKSISAGLALLWIWMGAAYFMFYFSAISPAAYIFGGAFIIQGLLFFAAGFYRSYFTFHYKTDIYGISGAILVLYALVIYPLLSYFAGHTYPASPTFGLPCPTTIFTFGVMLWLNSYCPVYLIIIPLLWSLIGSMAVLSLGMTEDTGLLPAGLLGAVLVFIKNRRILNTEDAPV